MLKKDITKINTKITRRGEGKKIKKTIKKKFEQEREMALYCSNNNNIIVKVILTCVISINR